MPERLPKSLRRRAADDRVTRRCGTCAHLEADHGTDRDGLPICWGAACGCYRFEPVTTIPARFDERYDPSPYGVVRRTA